MPHYPYLYLIKHAGDTILYVYQHIIINTLHRKFELDLMKNAKKVKKMHRLCIIYA